MRLEPGTLNGLKTLRITKRVKSRSGITSQVNSIYRPQEPQRKASRFRKFRNLNNPPLAPCNVLARAIREDAADVQRKAQGDRVCKGLADTFKSPSQYMVEKINAAPP
ncbi:uncharacterized protein ARMOST_22167 [Armillaria ostoyae]|uniref:Uncharacterized protein n=1 Tax=Armillaria ostoyae TaxID=47428 RepID=A0A284SC29_ARMOS|nr:uncharacterized protein ARMOST_22167 [Armillaria ostoyae]